MVTVCIKVKGSAVSRGIAICSMSDNPNRKTGRNIAEGRANRAINLKKDGFPVTRDRAHNVLFDSHDDIHWPVVKSEINPDLTEFEKKLLAR